MDLQAPSVARRHLGRVGQDWFDDVLETAKLATTELVANAVLHGDGPLTLVVDVRPEIVRVEVHDHGARHLPGSAVVPQPDAERGRGLLIVEAVADRWGVAKDELPPGKAVWFELGLTAR